MDDKRPTVQTDSTNSKEKDKPIRQSIEARNGSVIKDVIQLAIEHFMVVIRAMPRWTRWILGIIAVATVLIAAKALYDFYESSQPLIPAAHKLPYFVILDATERMEDGFGAGETSEPWHEMLLSTYSKAHSPRRPTMA